MVFTKTTKVHRLTSKELHNFKVLVFFVFLVYGLILPLWFVFYGDTFLHDRQRWSDIVVTKTRLSRSEYDEGKHINEKKNKIIEKRKTSNEHIRKSYPKTRSRAPPVLSKRSSETRGRLLSMRWNVCCQTINCLRKYPLFPLIPDKTGFLRNLRVSDSQKLYGQRITGRLSPPKTGNYSFVVKSMHATCELWLGLNEHPLSSSLVLKVVHGLNVAIGNDSSVNSTNNTERVKQFFEAELSSSKTYFIDIIFTVYRPLGNPIEVLWKLPNADKYTLITTQFLAGFSKKPSSLRTSLIVFSRAPSVRLSTFLETIEEQGEDDEDFRIIGGEAKKDDRFFDEKGRVISINISLHNTGSLPMINYKRNVSLLKRCLYSPSFLVNSSLSKYAGVWRTSFSSVFPKDNTGHMMCIENRYPQDCQGNTVISSETVQKLLKLYTRALINYSTRYTNDSHSIHLEKQTRLKLSSLVNIEEKNDPSKGSRFLLETILTDPGSNSYFHSDYLYMNKKGTSLCSPNGFTVDMYTTVNVVVVAKRQSRWLRHFLANMEKIYINTSDNHLNIIIAKYGMDDDNLMDEYKRNRLPNIRTVRHFGVFHKAKAIQSAVDTIQDPNGIIFLMDLHILAPETIISLVRKHTIRGKMVFNPVLFRLSHCGSPASWTKPSRGFWETFGYGILGIYKSDWDRIGGMSSMKHSRGWGGEDWELLDRILSAGLEIERLRVRNFYHFYHSKKNMWN